KVLLIKVFDKESSFEVENDIEEMKGLVNTAGGVVIDVVRQKRHEISPAYFIGRGKAEEIKEKYKNVVDLFVFDNELKPAQVRNLEDVFEKRVIDRTQLILDIFAQRAHTKEGKLQVEYAQLLYLLPRLSGRGIDLMQQTGGIGTIGPGETKLEVDKRKIKIRIQKIKKELSGVRDIREQQREKRKSIPVPLVAIVGYTNAGKTMFLNRMTNAGKLSEDKLFATLDPKIKRYVLPDGYSILFSDTVGFIKRLPTQLVAAFRATLEEVKQSDIILHLIDISEDGWQERRDVVYDVLKEIDAYEGKVIIEAYNKTDKINVDKKKYLLNDSKGIFISAKTGEGIAELINEIQNVVEKYFVQKNVVVPVNRSGLVDIFYKEGVVFSRQDKEDGIHMKVGCMRKTLEKFNKLKMESEIKNG
ncbi:MAG TPA: GTPase HflX, partial [Candidatus Goldiibacteriota bacterium]|nr:GTPase HflX [Candidatus Goldiibacteriota bacterium]